MTEQIDIRESHANDIALIEQLYPNAFPDEDLLPLVRKLLGEGTDILSLVGFVQDALVAHVIFTTCSIAGTSDKVALLGPLAVAPDWQQQGIGSKIVRVGLEQLRNAGTAQVFVLGDPNYYSRFGFQPDESVAPPYPLPNEWRGAWQSLCLHDDQPPLCGDLCVPQPWRQHELWLP